MKAFHPACFIILSAICGVAASPVHAQLYNKQKQSDTVWKGMDDCKRQAWKQNHDYTPEGNAKRDEAMKHCFGMSNAAPRISPLKPRESTGSSQPLR
jgi:hypothetical protein